MISAKRLLILTAIVLTALGCPCSNIARAADNHPRPPAVSDQMVRELVGVTGKEIRVITVDYLPGEASPPHRHHAQVFVYVLQGSVRMQLQGSASVTLHRGQMFYEGPEDIHVVSANASPTRPARILVFIVKDKAAPMFDAPDATVRP